MIYALLLVVAGVLPPLGPGRKLEVLPGVGRIAVADVDRSEVEFYSLEGARLGVLKTEHEPVYVCEVAGDIFVTTVSLAGVAELHKLSKTFEVVKTVKGQTLSSVSYVDGKWYGVDWDDLYETKQHFPKMAKEFNLETCQYGADSFFKLPKSVRENGFNFRRLWIYAWGNVRVVLLSGSGEAFLLDREHLAREKSDPEDLDTPVSAIMPLNIKDGFRNMGPFKGQLKILATEEGLREQAAWYLGKTQIFASWENSDGIMFACGEWGKKVSSVYLLTRAFETRLVLNVPGQVVAGSGQVFWIKNETETGVDIKSLRVKEK